VTRGLLPETVEFVVEQDAATLAGSPGGRAVISVNAGRVTLRIPPSVPMPRATGASGTHFATRIELLWLTSAEHDLLTGGGDIDAAEGPGAVIAPLLVTLACADDGADRDVDAKRGEQQRIAIMVRGLLSALAAEHVVDGEHDVSPQQRLAVLAMQLVHSRLEDPELTSGKIARQLGVSLRTLQAAFRQSPASVAEWIRSLRLERTWIEINTSRGEASIDLSALGVRWGFRGRDHFARAFERRYGMRPELAGGSRAAKQAS
jgi:AraC-like DNA-binding protein